jgi:hypothetical protein
VSGGGFDSYPLRQLFPGFDAEVERLEYVA